MSAGKQQPGTQGSSPGGLALQALYWPSTAVPPPPLGDPPEGPGPTLAWSGLALLAFLLGPLLRLVNPRSARLLLLHNSTEIFMQIRAAELQLSCYAEVAKRKL